MAGVGGPSSNLDVQKFSIQDIEDKTIFYFHSFPEQLSESKSANWTATEPQGRSSPLFGYSGSGARSFTIALHLFASIEAGDGRTPKDVKEACDWFLSLTYPEYKANGMVLPPHRVQVTWASLRTIICIVDNVSLSYSEDPWDVRTGLPMGAHLTITLSEVDDYPKDVFDVRGAAGPRQ